MKRQKLKNELLKIYSSSDTINSILNGRRRPKYEHIVHLNKKLKIPFTAWQDIKSYLQDNTARQSNLATAKLIDNIE